MDRGNNQPWDRLTDEQRRQWARRMEIYAAQIEHLDRAVGRVLAEIKRLGVEDNTLVIFLSDNGGAAEDPNGGAKSAPIGSRDSWRGYARPWATVSNTPWRRHKVTAFEGGISTPLLARWPAGQAAARRGQFVREPAHVLDLLPTFIELAGAIFPGLQPEGKSILPLLKGNPGDSNRTFCWEHQGNRAIRKGKWKLVALKSEPWELYDVETDRTESNNLAASKPDLVRELTADYDRWATRCGVQDYTRLTNP
jgi:arylsulfatase